MSPAAAVATHYVNGIQYTGITIDFIQNAEGIARNNAGTYIYEYNLTDLPIAIGMGNVRYTFNRHPVIRAVQVLQF